MTMLPDSRDCRESCNSSMAASRNLQEARAELITRHPPPSTHTGPHHGIKWKSSVAHAWGVLCQGHLTLKGRRPFPVPFLPSTTALGRSRTPESGNGPDEALYCGSWQKRGLRGWWCSAGTRTGRGEEGQETRSAFNPCRNPSERAASHPAPSSRSPCHTANNGSQTHCSKAGQGFIRNTQRNHHRALLTVGSGLGNTPVISWMRSPP